MSNDELKARYIALAHAVQTGVKYDLEQGSQSGTPKHLRVGVNVAMRDLASLVELLISKGLITETEYLTALVDGMQQEVKRYEAELSEKLGAKITLL